MSRQSFSVPIRVGAVRPSPHIHKLPSDFKATLIEGDHELPPNPAATAAQLVSAPMRTGSVRGTVVPSPNWPTELSPQAQRLPLVRRASTCALVKLNS